jgi:type IV secretory pathway TrbF-like protein
MDYTLNGLQESVVTSSPPLHETPDMPPDQLALLAAKVEGQWREIQRRDGNAVWHAWLWMRAFFVVLGMWAFTAAVGIWLYAHSRDVETFVQTVVYQPDGKFISLGVPQKLLAYEPEDGQWRDMLGEWVQKKQWRGEEPSATLVHVNWKWVYKHTCGDGTKHLERDEEKDKPFQISKLVRSVHVKSITKTPTPQSFQVLFEETTIDKAKGTKEVTPYTGTFLVGRYRPTSVTDALENNLGLCVTGYDIRQQSSS